ncbi:ABC transporter ATP-binding protein [Demequina lutea]|uniref:ABC-type multidrug transport system fused ATPase/permease subunit n=1 Tax=Demequina lutea TaxID=431489 RepID=A0A7Y9ZA33_9MICO|nr:ABC transporter ATP-binding protein [Demequina lutea]NYI41569.1 ABC-type multidrug transport system fused ATPase/permease subunit [Demequina lutea]
MSIGAAGIFGIVTVVFGSLLGIIVDDVVIPAIRREPILGWFGEHTQSGRTAILIAGAAFVAIGLINAILIAIRRAVQGGAVAGVGARHRTVVADAIASLPLGWHRANPAGRMLSAMSSDSETATNPLHPLAFTVGSFTMMVAAGYRLAVMDKWLAITAMMVIPAVLAVNVVYERVISPLWDAGQSLRAEVSTIAHESFEGGTVVKALGAEQIESERFAVKVDGLRDADTRVGAVSSWFEPLMDSMVPLSSLAIMIVGAYRAAAGAVTVGDVVSAIYLLALLAVPIRGIGWVLGQMPSALVSFQRVSRISAAATEVDEPGHLTLSREGAGHLGFRGAHVGADDGNGNPVVIVRDVTLDLAPGTVTALVGATGAGKTTVALAAARLSRAIEGAVILDDSNIEVIESLGSHVALVPQTSFVFAGTVRDNVTLGDDYSDEAVWLALKRAAIADVVAGLHQHGNALEAELEERGMNLSGGQRQRVAIARALVRTPRVLVLDDATSAVDPGVEQEILAALRADGAGPTVLLIAYRLASIMLADRIIHVDDGRVVDAGSHAELLERDAGYKELVTAYEQDTKRRLDEHEGSAS